MRSIQATSVDFRLRNDFITKIEELPFLPGAKWQDERPPPLDYLVDGCFLRNTVALISGDGGLGKSLLMQQLCACAVLGRDWLGMRLPRKVKAFALFCEDDHDELKRRQVAINRSLGIGMADLEDNLAYLSRPGRYNVLCEFAKWVNAVPQPTELFYSIARMIERMGAELVILDTASDVFGGNEIAKDQVRAFITLLRRLAIECHACVILTAHVSNEGLASESGLSGSRAWRNSVRRQLWLAENKEGLWLRGMKSNSGPRGLGNDPKKGIPLKWHNGVFVRVDQPVRNYSEPTLSEEWPG